jgi:hypothetical protein
MTAASLLDHDRWAVRARFMRLGFAALAVAASVALLMGFFFVAEFGAWPMLIPAALAVVAVTSFIFFAAHTPLSNEGVRRAQQWRGFRKYVQEVARDRQTPGDPSTAREWLPLAVAMGIAPAWSTYLKRHRAAAPPWFRAADDAGRGNAFALFVATGGAGHGGGSHGGGGAAGGGSSGAR